MPCGPDVLAEDALKQAKVMMLEIMISLLLARLQNGGPQEQAGKINTLMMKYTIFLASNPFVQEKDIHKSLWQSRCKYCK